MTELMAKAFEEAARLPAEVQDRIAQHVFEDLRRESGLDDEDPVVAAERRPLHDLPRQMEAEGRQRWMSDLFAAHGIEKESVDLEELRESFRQADLEPSELSRDLIAPRPPFSSPRRTSGPGKARAPAKDAPATRRDATTRGRR